ncbi:hypothetical protein J6590_005949 [Homalodisca vitripennis]|nr:hypothetical protein J6590_005949 [Homalodisca vitripennis]
MCYLNLSNTQAVEAALTANVEILVCKSRSSLLRRTTSGIGCTIPARFGRRGSYRPGLPYFQVKQAKVLIGLEREELQLLFRRKQKEYKRTCLIITTSGYLSRGGLVFTIRGFYAVETRGFEFFRASRRMRGRSCRHELIVAMNVTQRRLVCLSCIRRKRRDDWECHAILERRCDYG